MKEQPKDGEVVLMCAHSQVHGSHWFHYPVPFAVSDPKTGWIVVVDRDKKLVAKSRWVSVCRDCAPKLCLKDTHLIVENLKKWVVRGIIFTGDDPLTWRKDD